MKNAKITVGDSDITLEIEDVGECQFELWTVENEITSCVKIKIPDEIWIKLVNEWKEKRGDK